MKLYKVSIDDLISIVGLVSVRSYSGNVIFKTGPTQATRNCVNFTLRAKSSFDKGARRSHRGRKMFAACWHAHRDVMQELFKQFPQARLQSALADYRGAADFFETFDATGASNIGSNAHPVRIDTACNCESFEIAETHNRIVRKFDNSFYSESDKTEIACAGADDHADKLFGSDGLGN